MFLNRKFLKNVCAGLLVFSFVFMPISYNAQNHVVVKNESEAFLGGGDPATIWLVFKEQILDMIVWELINLVLEELVKSMTDWVRSGFRGSPAFVTDLNGFLLSTADEATSLFIEGSPLEFLCSDFKPSIQGALFLEYGNTTRYKARCTLDDIVENTEQFLEGDFYAGGWGGWGALTMNEDNNVYNASFKARGALSLSIENTTGEQLGYLNFGSGFFGQEECEGEGEDKVCQRITPGETVNESLNNALNIGNNRLEIADEFNELFGALLSQLVKGVLSKGLATFQAEPSGPAPSPSEAYDINSSANESGQRAIEQQVEQQNEIFDLLSAAAEYCRENYDKPLSDELVQQGYSIHNANWDIGDDRTVDGLEDGIGNISPDLISISSLEREIEAFKDNECE